MNEFIKEYIYIYGNSIWKIYHDSLDDNMLKMDIDFKRTIELLYKEIKSENISKNNLYLSLGVNLDANDNNNDDVLGEIMKYANEIKNNVINMDELQRNNCYFEIVSLLRMNNLDISLLKDKIDNDIMDKIFELYYGIKENFESKKTIQFSQLKEEDIKPKLILPQNNINKKKPKEISEQSKRILDYKNKIKYLTEGDNLRNENTSGKENDENKQMNNNNFFERMKQLDEITFQNKGKKQKYSNDNNTFEKISNMKKKLKEIRQKIN